MGEHTAVQQENTRSRAPDRPDMDSGAAEIGRGLRIRTLHWLILLWGVALIFMFLYATREVAGAVREMETAMERFAAAELAANDLRNASDNMTTCARLFAVTADPKGLEEYFHEAFQRRRRESAVATLRETMADTDAEYYLERALNTSNHLMEVEYHSMNLIAAALEYTPKTETARGELEEYPLTEEEAALSPEEKTLLGRDLVFNVQYQAYDERIEANVSACLFSLDDMRRTVQEESGQRLDRMVKFQLTLAVFLLAITGASILLSSALVLFPLDGYVRRITKFEPLPMTGAYELRYLARAYNIMYAENQRSSAKLRHEAEHDALTGLYNRGASMRLREGRRSGDFAMILMDVDEFKAVNDTYGHDIGDKVLQKVAKLLKRSFRATDYPCRMGGDEFAVILTDMKPEGKELLREKVRHIREKLLDTADGLPRTTLSIGVAFGTDDEDVYRYADAALYYVKEHGRDGCAFYEEIFEADA